jgi:hypothetical protein
MRLFRTITKKRLAILLFIAAFTLANSFLHSTQVADAAILSSATIQMSNDQPSATPVTYTVGVTFPDTTSIKCIDIIFGAAASDITLTANPSTSGAPAAMTTTSAALGTVSGVLTGSNYTMYNTNNDVVQVEDATGHAPSSASTATINITGITNTSTNGAFYAQVATYSSLATHVCSGLVDNTNIQALQTLSGVSATVTVQPTLSLAVADYGSAVNGATGSSFVTTTATTIPFGTVAAGANKDGSQSLTVGTNAAHGYSLYVSDTGTMKDPNNDTLADQTGTPGSAASFGGSGTTSAFGYTADGSVSFGSNQWAGLGNSGTQYAVNTNASATSSQVTHVQFRVEPSNTQAPGTYATTIVYTAVGSY